MEYAKENWIIAGSLISVSGDELYRCSIRSSLDAQGSNFIGKNNPDLLLDEDGNGIPYFLEDDDGDGIPNYKDPDNDTIKPVITLTGEMTVYIKVKDPEKGGALFQYQIRLLQRG